MSQARMLEEGLPGARFHQCAAGLVRPDTFRRSDAQVRDRYLQPRGSPRAQSRAGLFRDAVRGSPWGRHCVIE